MAEKNYYKMSRIISAVFIFLLPLSALWAAPVNKEQALEKARQFYNGRGQVSKVKKLKQVPRAADVSTAMENDCFYVFTAGGQEGFVIISGDDRTQPVLGYSDSGTFVADNMPDNMKAWLDGYAAQIRYLQKSDNDAAFTIFQAPTHSAVPPLMASKWDQGSPYNDKCPVFFDEVKYGKTVTGCVATAMAQILYYHKYPSSTTKQIPGYKCQSDRSEYLERSGTAYINVPAVPITKLDWSNMLDTYDGTETSTQNNAVATLMQACGASVEMDYGIDDVGGSSAFSGNVKKALLTYFDYDKSMRFVKRADYTSTEWDGLIYAEMAARRPVCFSGQSIDGGHEFVVDGYDGNGYFHVNWGWSGLHNGYYLLEILTPADDSGIGAGVGGYNSDQDALIGIKPNNNGSNPSDAVMTTDSIKIVGNKTFTRSASTANFQNVNVAASFWNYNGYNDTYDIGYGVYDSNGNLKSTHTLCPNIYFQHTYGLMCFINSLKINFGANLGNGKYRIVPISKLSQSSQWLPCSGSNSNYILATINSNNLTLSYPSEKMSGSISVTNNPEIWGPTDVKISITNSGADYIGDVMLYTTAGEDDVYYRQLLELKAGESHTRVATIKFNETGTFDIYLVLQDRTILASTTVQVTSAKTQSLKCTYNVTNGNPDNTIDGNTFEVDITYTNIGSNKYDNDVYVSLFKKRNDDSNLYDMVIEKTDRLTLEKGANVKHSYVFNDLEDGGIYYVQMNYNSAGNNKYYGNSQIYTVHHTAAPAVKSAYSVLSGNTLTFYYDDKRDSRSGKKYSMNTGTNYPEWAVDSLSITQARIDASFAEYRPETTAHWFEKQVNLTSIQGMTNLNTSATTTMMCMFYECHALQSVDVSNFDTRNVIHMGWMFYNCYSLKSLNLKNFNTSKVTFMRSMFWHCSSLTSLDLSSFDTQNVTDVGWMFAECNSLSNLNISKFNTAKVIKMNSVFSNCPKLTSLDLGHFNTSNATDMSYMFYGCTALSQLNVSSFNTSKVTNMRSMFYNMENLSSLDISNFLTPSVTDISFMFRGCSMLKELDLSGFSTSNVTDMRTMFYACSSLTTIYVKSSWDTSNVTNSNYMFKDCTSLVGGMGTKYNENYIDKTYARIDGGTSNPGYFTQYSTTGREAYAILNNSTLTFYYDSNRSNRTGKSYNIEAYYSNRPVWAKDSLSISTVTFDSSFAKYSPTSTANWFNGNYSKLTTVTGMNNLNTTNITDMGYMFALCKSLKVLDVSRFNTSKVTSMEAMFYGCYSLQSIDVSNFNTQNVTSFRGMFYNCTSLMSLDVSNFNTTSAIDMSFMFYNCQQLPTLDVSNFNTKNATDIQAMFDNCSSVKKLDLRNFNTSKVTSMGWLFYGCTSLTEINVRSFNTSNTTDMRSMFYNCENLTALDVSSFNTSNVTDMAFMFRGCSKLKELDLRGFNVENVTEIRTMFYNCKALTTIYVQNSWNLSKVENSSIMFGECTSLVGGKGTRYNANYVDKTYARIDGGTSSPGYFTYKEAGKNGDVNSDGVVDVADIGYIIDVMASGSNVSRADVNSDGVVDVADIGYVIDVMAANARRMKEALAE